MLSVKHILAPTDFSEPSYEAIHLACEMAQHFAAQITLLHVIASVPIISTAHDQVGFDVVGYQEELEAYAHKMLEKLEKEKIPSDLRTQKVVLHGDPASAIIDQIRDTKYDLIVISTHGMTGLRHILFGSVTERVLKSSSIPVLTVPYHQS